MSPQNIFYIIVGILIFDYLVERVLEYLNDKNWSDSIPDELKSYYDEDKVKKSSAYNQTKNRFGMITSSFSFILILSVLFFGGFSWLDTFVRSFTTNPILMALMFFGILGIASDILTTPFSLYSTFVIEEKFGFNKTTLKTFFLDKIKGYFLGAIIGGALLSALVWFYEKTGESFWLYAWGIIVAFMIFMTMFYASLIVPLFNKLEPMKEGELRSAIEAFCSKVGFPLRDLYVMDGSKRSTKANAFFSGLGKSKRIVLFDTLIEKQSTEEIVAVLAHEIGHFKKKHTRTSLVISVLQTGLMFFLLSLVIRNPLLANALEIESVSFHIGMLTFGLLYSPISMLLGIGMSILSRKNEYEADRYAKENYNAEALQTSLKKLSSDHLSNLYPHPAYVFVHYSHPPLLSRLKALKT
jgi:STE24 endopeptidase